MRITSIMATISVVAVAGCMEAEDFARGAAVAVGTVAMVDQPYYALRQDLWGRTVVLEQGSFASAATIQFRNLDGGRMTFTGPSGQGEGSASVRRGTQANPTALLCMQFGPPPGTSPGAPLECFPAVMQNNQLTLTHAAGGTSRWRVVDAGGLPPPPPPPEQGGGGAAPSGDVLG